MASGRLIVEDLDCVRGGRRVLSGLSFMVPRGGALFVSGPNGAGKSSLLRLLAGLLEPAAGGVHNPFRTAYLGHDNALKNDRTLAAELAFWARLDGVPRVRAAEALARFGLEPLAELPVRILSSGQRRRAGLARLWASGAELWLLDEPSVGLDTAALMQLSQAMQTHRAAGGLVVAASHVPLGLEAAQVLALA